MVTDLVVRRDELAAQMLVDRHPDLLDREHMHVAVVDNVAELVIDPSWSMPQAERLRRLIELAERYGWPFVIKPSLACPGQLLVEASGLMLDRRRVRATVSIVAGDDPDA